MSAGPLKRRFRRAAEQIIIRVAPLTHLIPERLRHGVRDGLLKITGISKGKTPRRPPLPFEPGRDPAGINLFGFFKAQNGLAQGLKLYARAIEEAGICHRFLNTDFLYWLPQNDTDWDEKLSGKAEFAVNVVHINPDQWVEACNNFPIETFDGRYNIGVWLWELETIPASWCDQLKYVDELWAPSTFIAEALRRITDKPVIFMPYGIEAPTEEGLSRADFGLPEDAFLALIMFDSNSYASRKNPAGAIEAFLRAFGPEDAGAKLVIKVNHPKEEDLKAIRRAMGDESRYILIDETLSKRRLNRLISLCDVFVSLHRAEGFGLVMGEAMALGVPVVATDWSANVDFMPHDVACMVDASLIPVDGSYQFDDGSQRWADPDLDQAAGYLRKLRGDPAWAKELGLKGQAFIHGSFSVANTAERMKQRLAAILETASDGKGQDE